MSEAPQLDRELQIVAAILGVPCSPENREHLTRVLEERERSGLRPFAGPVDQTVELAEAAGGVATSGRYEIGEMPTGAAELLPATDLELHRTVALRLIPPAGREEALDAVRLHARLEHPNVQALHDLGVTARRPWSERLGGRLQGESSIVFAVEQERPAAPTFAQLLSAAKSPSSERVELLAYLRDVADALAYAHELGIVRDGLAAEDITVGPFGEVTVWNWTAVSSIREGRDRRRDRDLSDLAGLVTRAGTGGGVPLAPELERAVALAVAGDGTVAELALALAAYLERASEVALDRRAARHELELGNEAWARMIASNHRLEHLRRRTEELEPFADDAGLEKMGFEEHARTKQAYRQARIDAATARSDAMRHFRAAVRHDPGLEQARDALAAMHWEYLEEAASWNDTSSVEFHRRALERFDDGSRLQWLNDPRALRVESDPPGASVQLYCYEPVFGGRVLEEQLFRDLGTTPTRSARIPQGSYVLVLRREGFPDTRHPIVVRHGFDSDVHVLLRTAEEIGEGMLYVPAGVSLVGGDPVQPKIGPFRREQMGGFCIGRTHVTCGEYLEFLNELAETDPALAASRQPRAGFGGSSYWERAPGGGYRLPARPTDPARPWAPDLPVVGIHFDDARAFLEWDSRRRGQSLDLPLELAWEKAVRGADGRLHPWGDYFDSTLCNATVRERGLLPVGSFATDCSPYGMVDAAGNAQEFLRRIDPITGREVSVVRGGCFYTVEFLARATAARTIDRRIPGDLHGFRRFRMLEE